MVNHVVTLKQKRCVKHRNLVNIAKQSTVRSEIIVTQRNIYILPHGQTEKFTNIEQNRQ